MKQLKNVIYFIFALTVILSCEKETIIEQQNLNNEVEGIAEDIDFKSLHEMILSGVDMESYFKSLSTEESLDSKTEEVYKSVDYTNLEFFFGDMYGLNYPCQSELSFEDFGEATTTYNSVGYFLDENTNNYVFSPGDILSGISFESNSSLYMWGDNYTYWNADKVLYTSAYNGNLTINFTSNNVTDVSMKIAQVYTGSYTNISIYVYGNSGYLGSSNVYIQPYGKYWGVKSTEPIKQIILTGNNPGVDDISFGECDDDFDNDGVLNGNDPYPYSNLSEEVSIDGCYPNVENVFVVPGATMMDYIDEIINELNTQYDGSNWEELHRDFSNQLASLTASWKVDRLISRRQRSAIFKCVKNSNIPYFTIH